MMEILDVTAINLRRDIDIKKIEKKIGGVPISKEKNRVVFKTEKGSFIYLYSFGSIVFVGPNKDYMRKMLKKLMNEDLNTVEIKETYGIRKSKHDDVRNDFVCLKSINQERVTIVADILAQSTGLRRYEVIVNQRVGMITSILNDILKVGNFRFPRRRLMKMIIETSILTHEIVSKLSLLETPRNVWENEENEKLFEDMRLNFEIDERFEDLLMKIDHMNSDLEKIMNFISTINSERLEWIIIILIFFEIIIWLYEILI